MIETPEPEPYEYEQPTGQDPCIIQVNVGDYLLLWVGAGVGYFIMGFYSTLCCSRNVRNRDSDVIVAESIN